MGFFGGWLFWGFLVSFGFKIRKKAIQVDYTISKV